MKAKIQVQCYHSPCGDFNANSEVDMKAKIQVQCYHSPCGDLLLGSFGDKLCLCNWVVEKHSGRIDRRLQTLLKAEYENAQSDITCEAIRQLNEYFRWERQSFDMPLLLVGTEFQKRVWNRLLEIPYGETLSYGDMAQSLGIPKAVRAVANANGANAISLFVPCHRVIGSNGSLTGFGGGIEVKKFLLALERQ